MILFIIMVFIKGQQQNENIAIEKYKRRQSHTLGQEHIETLTIISHCPFTISLTEMLFSFSGINSLKWLCTHRSPLLRRVCTHAQRSCSPSFSFIFTFQFHSAAFIYVSIFHPWPDSSWVRCFVLFVVSLSSCDFLPCLLTALDIKHNYARLVHTILSAYAFIYYVHFLRKCSSIMFFRFGYCE